MVRAAVPDGPIAMVTPSRGGCPETLTPAEGFCWTKHLALIPPFERIPRFMGMDAGVRLQWLLDCLSRTAGRRHGLAILCHTSDMGDRRLEPDASRFVNVPGLQSQVQVTEIREAMERIRFSRTFAHSRRLLELLDFVTAATLRGDGPRLNETAIGVALYRRNPSYDPNLDGIVRTQAKRLHERLSEYYGTEGAGDPIVIRLSKRGYTPLFKRRFASTEANTRAIGTATGLWSAALAALAIAGGVFAYLKIHPRLTSTLSKDSRVSAEEDRRD